MDRILAKQGRAVWWDKHIAPGKAFDRAISQALDTAKCIVVLWSNNSVTSDWVMEEAYSHEVSSAGFWPGAGLGEAAFYAYAYPEPEGFSDYPVKPEAAYYHKELGEYVLPYEAVRTAPKPDAPLLAILEATYAGAAEKAGWDRAALDWDGEEVPAARRDPLA